MEITSEEIELLCKMKMQYFYLASLISSDNILTIKDAEDGLKNIERGEKAVEGANISEERKNEFRDYFKKGREILENDIKRFKEEEK